MNPITTLILSLFWVFESISTPLGYYTGERLSTSSLQALATSVKPGSVVVIGEPHDNKMAQQGQLEIMKALRAQGHTVSVGMEFISYPDQATLDEYRSGTLAEAEFLKKIGWGNNYDVYRDQILFPMLVEGARTIAINAPRYLTTKIRKTGFQSLTADEMALLPPDYQGGNDSYRERFAIAAGHHLTPASFEGYFNAQSVWDDTMAWKTAEFLKANPTHVFVIVVGQFHAEYGGGLPDRLKARGVTSVLTVSQVDHSIYSDEELETELMPHSKFGPRADYLWIF